MFISFERSCDFRFRYSAAQGGPVYVFDRPTIHRSSQTSLTQPEETELFCIQPPPCFDLAVWIVKGIDLFQRTFGDWPVQKLSVRPGCVELIHPKCRVLLGTVGSMFFCVSSGTHAEVYVFVALVCVYLFAAWIHVDVKFVLPICVRTVFFTTIWACVRIVAILVSVCVCGVCTARSYVVHACFSIAVKLSLVSSQPRVFIQAVSPCVIATTR